MSTWNVHEFSQQNERHRGMQARQKQNSQLSAPGLVLRFGKGKLPLHSPVDPAVVIATPATGYLTLADVQTTDRSVAIICFYCLTRNFPKDIRYIATSNKAVCSNPNCCLPFLVIMTIDVLRERKNVFPGLPVGRSLNRQVVNGVIHFSARANGGETVELAKYREDSLFRPLTSVIYANEQICRVVEVSKLPILHEDEWEHIILKKKSRDDIPYSTRLEGKDFPMLVDFRAYIVDSHARDDVGMEPPYMESSAENGRHRFHDLFTSYPGPVLYFVKIGEYGTRIEVHKLDYREVHLFLKLVEPPNEKKAKLE